MTRCFIGVLLLGLAPACAMSAGSPEPTGRLPKPAHDLNESTKPGKTRAVVFAGGCFWCMEAVFEQLNGVTSVVSGFAGGTAETAHYETVSSGITQHAESVQVTYDPSQISYSTLLQVFFATHHPTQRAGQGPDHGHQYRAAIFYANDQQKEVAQAYIRQLEQARIYREPIATTLEPLNHFYPAEDYHQDFVAKHPDHPYVRAWSLPKLKIVREQYPELLKSK